MWGNIFPLINLMNSTFDIHKILIPIDFSETSQLALDHAAFMASRYDAEIIFLHVFETFSYQMEISQMLVQSVKVGDVVKEKLEALARETHKKYSVKVSTEMTTGSVATNVVEAAERLGADIIIMGTHGASGFEEFFIGSNAYKVVTKTGIPVLSVQTHAEKVGFKDIVVPIDNSKASRQKLRYAASLAKKYNSVLHVVSLITDPGPDMDHKFGIIEEQVSDFLKEKEVRFEVKRINGDNIAKMTMEYANDIKADLITIMTEQEPNIAGFILGPYAQQVVNHSKIPVLSITPDDAKNVIFNPY